VKVLEFSFAASQQSSQSSSSSQEVLTASQKKRLYRNQEGVYLKPFEHVIRSVFSPGNAAFVDGLLDDEELAVIDKFKSAPLPARKLYVRIFERKWAWHDPADVEYLEIDEDLNEHFEELAERGLFQKGNMVFNAFSSFLMDKKIRDLFLLSKSLFVKFYDITFYIFFCVFFFLLMLNYVHNFFFSFLF
jgi:hypothetical protein